MRKLKVRWILLTVQMLQWTPDLRRGVSEIARVVRPGGLIFGAQGSKTGILETVKPFGIFQARKR